MPLAQRYAVKAGDLCQSAVCRRSGAKRSLAALDNGADIIAIARGALANPALPRRLLDRSILNDFDPTILGPIANIKDARAGDVNRVRLKITPNLMEVRQKSVASQYFGCSFQWLLRRLRHRRGIVRLAVTDRPVSRNAAADSAAPDS